MEMFGREGECGCRCNYGDSLFMIEELLTGMIDTHSHEQNGRKGKKESAIFD